MLGPNQEAQSTLFYGFSTEDHVPTHHVLRAIDGVIDFSGVRKHLTEFYSSTGSPSIDPELMITAGRVFRSNIPRGRMLLAG